MSLKHSSKCETKITEVRERDIQPNAVDIRFAKAYKISPESVFTINDDEKKHHTKKEILPDSDGTFYLPAGSYEVVLLNEFEVGMEETGWVITRSTLLRNGVSLHSGLFDSGYKGKIGLLMNVNAGPLAIKKGTAIGQYLCFAAETTHAYDGDYGEGKEHDKRYD